MARGRPPKADSETLHTKGLRLQLTPAQRAELERRAAAYGSTLSEFCRAVMLSDLKAPIPTSRDGAAVREFTVALNRIGNSVNQLRRAYFTRREEPEAQELREISDRLWLLYQKAMKL